VYVEIERTLKCGPSDFEPANVFRTLEFVKSSGNNVLATTHSLTDRDSTEHQQQLRLRASTAQNVKAEPRTVQGQFLLRTVKHTGLLSRDALKEHGKVAHQRIRRVDERGGFVLLEDKVADPRERVRDKRHRYRHA